MKIKKSSLVLEYDDFGFGSYLIALVGNLKRELKVSYCPIEGVIYYY